jgi:hypothetical protein
LSLGVQVKLDFITLMGSGKISGFNQHPIPSFDRMAVIFMPAMGTGALSLRLNPHPSVFYGFNNASFLRHDDSFA